ncbi:hypothetical protein Hanom_Chr12g01106371 [Helianthus anomalus]
MPIWVVDPTFKTHMTGNRNLFKVFKRHFGVITNEKRKEFSFIHGIGEVKVPSRTIVYQGIEVVTSGDTCTLKRMFGDRAKGFDVFENKSEVDLEQEYLDKFYENLDVENGYLNEKEKLQEYLEDFYEKEFEIERQKNK